MSGSAEGDRDWSSTRANRTTVGGYFLAGRSMTWWPIGASLMSSNVGSGLFIGLAGTGAAGGIAVGGFEWNATWVLVALGWIFIPVYISSGVVTMPEYLAKRFGGSRIRIYMSVLSLILYIFTKVSTCFQEHCSSRCHWVGTFICLRAYYCWLQLFTQWQVIVQRSLSAKSLSHAKAGSVLGGYLKLMPMFFIVMPGMISRALFPDEIGCVDPALCRSICGASVGCSNMAYPKLVVELMPVGLRGLMLAVILAALMSSLTSIFNSSSTLFTLDLYHRARPRASEMELMIVGRVFILVLMCISLLWIPVVQTANSGQLFDYIQSVTSFLAPPITAVFVMAIFWPRANEQGAFWGLMTGLAVGLTRMIMEFSYFPPSCGQPDHRPSVVTDVHYLYFALILLALTCLVIVVVSLVTAPIPKEQLYRLTWWSRNDIEPQIDLSNSQATPDPVNCDRPDDDPLPQPTWKRIVMWLCGLSRQAQSAHPAVENQDLNFLQEKSLWRNVCNMNALLLLAVNVFLWGYFA